MSTDSPLTNIVVESGGEVKVTKQNIIAGDDCAGFEAVERDTVYNRVELVRA